MKKLNHIFVAILLFAFNPLQAQTDTEEKTNIFLYQDFQISFVPFLGTNGVNSGKIINDYSFNILGGYSAGTNKLEMAGLFNINRTDMKYAQFAGVFNQVNGSVTGAQFAGVLNSNLKGLKGFQAAGVTNFSTGDIDGTQLAGVLNFTTKKVKGFQAAGVFNFAAANVEGTQLAGVSNFIPKDIQGAQISGVFNFARKVNGFQLGLLNYSDSISGVPIGLISIVRSGYHTVELSTNEVMPLNLSLRTGKRQFYNILSVGIRPEIEGPLTWSFGYGIGSSPRLGRKTYLNIELGSEQVNLGNVLALNLVNKLYLGGEIQVTPKLAIFGGPTLNYRVFDSSYDEHPTLFAYGNPQVRNEKNYIENDLTTQVWWGFKTGIRFF